MKNLGISTKKFVRKITAIASAAFMAGVSMGVAAADLSSLTSTFIEGGQMNAYVVVGTGGASNVVGFAKDVAGSIVVASAFAQQAKTVSGSSGSATLSRNLTSGYLNSSTLGSAFNLNNPRDANIGKSVDQIWTQATAGFDWLPNKTVSNSTGVIANMTGELSIAAGKIKITELGTVRIEAGAIVYNLTFGKDGRSLFGGVGKNTTGIELPDGKSYKITGWKTDGVSKENITLGDFNQVNTTQGTVNQIGSTGATFEVVTYTSIPNNELKIKVKNASGNILFDGWVAAGNEIYSNSDFTLNLVSYRVPAGVVDATIEWSTKATTLVEGDSTTAITSDGANWTIVVSTAAALTAVSQANAITGNDTNNITGIAWQFKAPEGRSYIEVAPGTNLKMLDGLFNLTVGSLQINSTDKKEASVNVLLSASDSQVRLVDANNTAHVFDIKKKSGQFTSAGTAEINWYIGNTSSVSITLTCNQDSALAHQGETIQLSTTRDGRTLAMNVTNGSPFYLNTSSPIPLAYNISANISVKGTDCTNAAKYNLSLINFTTNTGRPLYNNLTWVGSNSDTDHTNSISNMDYTDGYFLITEPLDSRWVKIQLDNGTLPSGAIDYSLEDNIIDSTGSYYYTVFGTKFTRVSSSEISIGYPENNRTISVTIGRVGKKLYPLTDGQYDTDLDVTLESGAGSTEKVNKIDVGLAKLDSEITSSSLDKPVILMGGWAVNSLVNELANAGLINKADLTDNRAMVKLIDNAFNGKSALVIAGFEGDDTRLAAQVVASQVLGTMNVLSGSSAILNTGVASYGAVTVV